MALILRVVLATAVLGSGIGFNKLYLFHIALLLFVLSFVLQNIATGSRSILIWPKGHFIYFLYFMFFWYGLSLAWSIQPADTFRYLFYLANGIFIVFICVAYSTSQERYASVFKTLRLVFLLSIAVALLEAFTKIRLPTSPFSEFAEFFGRKSELLDLKSDVEEFIKSSPTSFWGNPNTLAVAMTIIAPFFLFYSESKTKVFGLVCILIVIVMTGSRGALIGLSIGFGTFLLMRGLRHSFLALIIFAGLFVFFSEKIENLKQSNNKKIVELAWTGDALHRYLFDREMSGDSIGSRQLLMQNGLDALWQTGGLGVGGGGSQALQERLGKVAGRLTSMHNFWLEVLVDAGALFFIMFMFWYFYLAYTLYIIHKKSVNGFYQYHAGALFVSMVTFLFSAVSASSVIYFLPMWLMFGMAIALSNIYRMEVKDAHRAYFRR